MEVPPPLALTVVDRITPTIARTLEVSVAQNRLPSELGRTPAMLAFSVMMRAWARTPPSAMPPAMNPATNTAMGEARMVDILREATIVQGWCQTRQ